MEGLDALLAICAAKEGHMDEALALARLALVSDRDPGGLAAELVASVGA